MAKKPHYIVTFDGFGYSTDSTTLDKATRKSIRQAAETLLECGHAFTLPNMLKIVWEGSVGATYIYPERCSRIEVEILRDSPYPQLGPAPAPGVPVAYGVPQMNEPGPPSLPSSTPVYYEPVDEEIILPPEG